MPEAFLEERLPRINEVLVVNYVAKIESHPLIADSEIIQAFVEGDESGLAACVKRCGAKYNT